MAAVIKVTKHWGAPHRHKNPNGFGSYLDQDLAILCSVHEMLVRLVWDI